MTPRRLRLGMVGGGAGSLIGAVHRLAARLDDQFELVAGAFSSDPGRGAAAAETLHVAPARAYPDFGAMAAAEAALPEAARIDVVSVVTPNDSHVPIARRFLEAGIPVICDKPLATSLQEARQLAELVRARALPFVLTHNYSGYPLVREARARVTAGELGALRVVQVEYPQDWLTEPLEQTGQKQAAWRTDPARSGPTGCTGDIGTHAHQLACFVTGLRLDAVAADLSSFVPGRRLDDDARMLLRFEGGARGMLWASQVAPGHENGLRLRVYGDTGSLEWVQASPNEMSVTRYGEPSRRLTRGMPSLSEAATRAARVPAGHPEGYLEAFAQLYSDAALWLRAHQAGQPRPAECEALPGIETGVAGMAFIEAALASSRSDAGWVRLQAAA